MYYSKCSKIFKHFSCSFSNKILVYKAGIHKTLVRIANRECPDQTASSDIYCIILPFSSQEHFHSVNELDTNCIVYSYFMPVCSIVKTITLSCSGRPDALLH